VNGWQHTKPYSLVQNPAHRSEPAAERLALKLEPLSLIESPLSMVARVPSVLIRSVPSVVRWCLACLNYITPWQTTLQANKVSVLLVRPFSISFGHEKRYHSWLKGRHFSMDKLTLRAYQQTF
jgi:hypothetical protein